MLRKKSQSILEYVIILAAVVAALIATANSVINPAVQQMITDSADVIENKSAQFINLSGGGFDKSTR